MRRVEDTVSSGRRQCHHKHRMGRAREKDKVG
jgi:hypothetical protein